MVDQRHDDELDESFADLFEESLQEAPPTIQPGDKVSGRVVQVGAQRALLDLGGGLDGMIELSQLAEPGEEPTVQAGDRVEAYVVRVQDRVVELARSLGRGAAAKAALEDAAHAGVPVEGTITAVNKGGYVVEVAGERAFCPLGQMDVRRIDDPATMIGRKLDFRIAEWRGGKDIVLSRRALLEEEAAARAVETRARLEVGARFQGTISRVMDFGAFVDIGGIEGLVHASELAYGRVRPRDLVHEGQGVEVEVLRIDEGRDGKERISLSMRALAEDPFEETVAELPEGTIVEGKVTRLQPFGAFVEIVPGVEGLLHVSAFGKRIAHPSEVVAEGQAIPVRIDAVDRDARRISLSYLDPEELEMELGPAEGEGAGSEMAPAMSPPAEVAPEPRPQSRGGKERHRAPQADAGMVVRRAKGSPEGERAASGPAAARGSTSPAGAGAGAGSAVKAPGAVAGTGGDQGPASTSVAGGRSAPPERGGERAAAPMQRAGEGGIGAKPRVLGHSAPRLVDESAAQAPAPVAPGAPPAVGTVLDVTVDKVEPFGVFVSWEGGRGLVPAGELGVPRGADLRRSHPVGTAFRAAVLDVRPDGKVRLSLTGAELAEERAQAEAWARSQPKQGGSGLGTLGDLLKGKLGK